jgi:hypothetical protein
MDEAIWISHIQEIALNDDWVTVTDLMGHQYRLDPQVALELAVWIAEHAEDVAQAQVRLQVAQGMEEARLYGPFLGSIQPPDPPQPASSPSPPKRRRRSPRKKEKT